MEDWNKPQLVVLVRSTSEEAILVACKGTPASPGLTNDTHPSSTYSGCRGAVGSSVANGIRPVCASCESIASS